MVARTRASGKAAEGPRFGVELLHAFKDAFARSVLWGFTVAAETGGRVLADAAEWLLRDNLNLAPRLKPGSYKLDEKRSIRAPATSTSRTRSARRGSTSRSSAASSPVIGWRSGGRTRESPR